MNLVLFSLALIIFKVMSVFCTVSSALCVCVCVCVCDMTCLGGCPLTSDQADICVCVSGVGCASDVSALSCCQRPSVKP